MQQPTNSATRQKEPVELLIARILRHGFARTLASGVVGLVPACTESIEPANSTEGANAGSGQDAQAAEEPRTRDASVPAKDAAPAVMDASAPVIDAASPVNDAAAPVDGSRDPTRDVDGAAMPTDGGPVQTDAGAAPFACEPGSAGAQMQASGLRLTESFDYVAIRRVGGTWGVGPFGGDAGTNESWTRGDFTTLSEHGEACANASSGACAEKIAHHPAEFVQSHCVQACSEFSVVTSRGDQVRRWVTDADLQRLWGEVDSVDEALLLVTRAGYWDGCAREAADGYEVSATHYKGTCPIVYERVRLHVAKTGALRVVNALELPPMGSAGACVGRVPAALLTASRPQRKSEIGDYLAACAHLEDASVHAFERLAKELMAYDAPRELVAAAMNAAADEVRHARVVGGLARARAGEPVAAEVGVLPTRTLEEIALENATEGCVRETFGALVGGYQAQHAADPEVRAALREVAEDEARHAALAQRVHDWALNRLDESARARVLSAQRRAVGLLYEECAADTHAELREPLGLPCPRTAQALLRALAEGLWGVDSLTPYAAVAT